jgi:hypothetical protein
MVAAISDNDGDFARSCHRCGGDGRCELGRRDDRGDQTFITEVNHGGVVKVGAADGQCESLASGRDRLRAQVSNRRAGGRAPGCSRCSLRDAAAYAAPASYHYQHGPQEPWNRF